MKKLRTLGVTLLGFIVAGVISAAPSDAMPSTPSQGTAQTDISYPYPVFVSGTIKTGFNQRWSDGHRTSDAGLGALYRECEENGGGTAVVEFCKGAWYGEYNKLKDWENFQIHYPPKHPCSTEDALGPCFWDAGERGGGKGHSFIVNVLHCVHFIDPSIPSYCRH